MPAPAAMLAYSRAGINTGGHAYDWSRGKEFGAAQAMRAYDRAGIVLEGEPPDERHLRGSLQGRDVQAPEHVPQLPPFLGHFQIIEEIRHGARGADKSVRRRDFTL